MPDESITPEAVRARARIADVTLDESKIEDIAFIMEMALKPLRRLDPRAMREIEPAVSFRAATDGQRTNA
jgi:hypothetical protein